MLQESYYRGYSDIPMALFKGVKHQISKEFGDLSESEIKAKVLNIVNSSIESTLKDEFIGITDKDLKMLYIRSYLVPSKQIVSDGIQRFINANKKRILVKYIEDSKSNVPESTLVYDKIDLRYRLGSLALSNFKSEAPKSALEQEVDLSFIKEGLLYKVNNNILLTLKLLSYMQYLLNCNKLPYVELTVNTSKWKITPEGLHNYGLVTSEDFIYGGYWYNFRKDPVSLEYLKRWLIEQEPELDDDIMYDLVNREGVYSLEVSRTYYTNGSNLER